MRRWLKYAGLLFVVLALTLGSVSQAFAATNGNRTTPVLNKVVFIHHTDEPATQNVAPARPSGERKALYKYNGIRWADSSIPVYYVVDDRGNTSFLAGIKASFDTWENDPLSYIDFECKDESWKGTPSSFIGNGSRNGVNEVGWVPLSSSYSNAIAVTMIWYGRDKYIVEVDTAMNSDLPWIQNTVAGDPDTQTGVAGYYDVQNIMTHEAGHWLMLGDLYNKAAKEQTMYGYGSTGELKARSLESGDLAGLRQIYPVV